MSKCRLDIDEPRLMVLGNAPENNLREGLIALRDKIAENHKMSMWFNHPIDLVP